MSSLTHAYYIIVNIYVNMLCNSSGTCILDGLMFSWINARTDWGLITGYQIHSSYDGQVFQQRL